MAVCTSVLGRRDSGDDGTTRGRAASGRIASGRIASGRIASVAHETPERSGPGPGWSDPAARAPFRAPPQNAFPGWSDEAERARGRGWAMPKLDPVALSPEGASGLACDRRLSTVCHLGDREEDSSAIFTPGDGGACTNGVGGRGPASDNIGRKPRQRARRRVSRGNDVK